MLLLAVDFIITARAVYKLLEVRWRYKYVPRALAKQPVRVWVDGVFDMMHFGHANMLRQAKALGDFLVVGVNSSETVFKEKGSYPVMTDDERYLAVGATKWVDQVVPKTPYVMDSAYIKYVIDTYKIDIFVHGDDPCFDSQGNDVYGEVKAAGKFRTVKRTEGVSSTELVGRMLLMTKDHHKEGMRKLSNAASKVREEGEEEELPTLESFGKKKTRVSHFLPTTRRISQFSSGKPPKPGDKVVYVDGTWDLFHPGHIEFMRKARELGDFLLVGICDDETVNLHKGSNWPIMDLHERTLCVLSCKYVDEVIIGAPWEISRDLITTMNVSLVVHGSHQDYHSTRDPYRVAKEMNIFKEIDSPSPLTTEEIVDRILKQRESYQKRYESKAKKEEEYYEKKTHVQEI
jgi:ethanolamine-phosphate cytidylyltransferase